MEQLTGTIGRLPETVVTHGLNTGAAIAEAVQERGWDATLDLCFTTLCQGCLAHKAETINHLDDANKRVVFSNCRASSHNSKRYKADGIVDLYAGVQLLCNDCHKAFTAWQRTTDDWAVFAWPVKAVPTDLIAGPVPR